MFLLQQIGNDVVMGGLGSTYVYFAFGYEGGLYSLFNTVGLAATALLMIFYPMLAKRFRRKQMMDKLMLLSVIGYARYDRLRAGALRRYGEVLDPHRGLHGSKPRSVRVLSHYDDLAHQHRGV